MWNHAPVMWASMRERSVQAGELSAQGAADLFAYFYSARFFEKPGDAGRGKSVFASKHCANCHGMTEAKLPNAKPVSEWRAIGDPIELADAMWNHAASMRGEFARVGLQWAELDPQDLDDILVYLRNLPSRRGSGSAFDISAGANGAELFKSKGCAGCHTGKLELAPLLKNKTLTGIAAAMWNHEPKMAAEPPRLTVDEMRALLGYLWASEFFTNSGNAGAGERLFASKHCVTCHSDAYSGAPALPRAGEIFTGATMVSALWHHGPRMLDQMQAKHIAWPHFDGQDMSNIIAYLDSKNAVK